MTGDVDPAILVQTLGQRFTCDEFLFPLIYGFSGGSCTPTGHESNGNDVTSLAGLRKLALR